MVSSLDPDDVIIKVEAERVLSSRNVAELNAIVDRETKAGRLIDVLKQKSDAAFDSFKDVLVKTEQLHLVCELEGDCVITPVC